MQTRAPTLILAAALGLAAGPALSQEPAAGMTVGAELSGEVMVVNTETRLMTIKDAEGEYHVLHVPPEVTRLDEIKIGDEVTITEISSALIEIVPAAEAGPVARETSTDIERAPGKKPAGSITDSVTVYGKVVGLDKAGGSITIETPDGQESYEVSNPSVLEGVAVGDGVVARFRNTIIGEVR